MKRIVRLTESDLARIVKRVIREQGEAPIGMPNPAAASKTQPFELIVFTKGGFTKNIKFNKQNEDSYDSFENADKITLCELFDDNKATFSFKNTSAFPIRITDMEVLSFALDLVPNMTGKSLKPGEKIQFDVEIETGQLRRTNTSLRFNIEYQPVDEDNKRNTYVGVNILNNITECI